MKTVMLILILLLALVTNSVAAQTRLHSKVSGQGQAILLIPSVVSDDRESAQPQWLLTQTREFIGAAQ